MTRLPLATDWETIRVIIFLTQASTYFVAKQFIRVEIGVLLRIVIDWSRRGHLEAGLVIDKAPFETNALVHTLLILRFLNHVHEPCDVFRLILIRRRGHVAIEIELVPVRLSLHVVIAIAIEGVVHLIHEILKVVLFVARII